MTGTFLFIALAFCREISAFSARPLQNQQLQTVSWLRKTKHRMHSSGFSHRYMAEMHDSFKYGETIASNINSVVGSSIAETSNKRTDISVSFSHIQLFVDHMESLEFYKAFEVQLNKLDAAERSSHLSTDGRRNLWVSLLGEEVEEKPFIPQNRDIVKQLMAGFGFRVTGYRLPSIENTANTKSLLITSLDSGGVQLVVSALADPSEGEPRDDFVHFDACE